MTENPPPTFEKKNQNKGIEDIMDIDSNCPYLLFGETTSHLTSKWHLSILFFNVENTIKRQMKWERIGFLKKKKLSTQPSPPPPPKFFLTPFFFYVANSIQRKENMKYWRIFFSLNNIASISKTTFLQYQKLYSTPPWHGACTCKVRENTSMRFWVTVRKLNVMDRQTYGRTGGVAISPVPGQTDIRTDGRGALQYLPPTAQDNKEKKITTRFIYIYIYGSCEKFAFVAIQNQNQTRSK